jgi:DNA polymerase (family 10)
MHTTASDGELDRRDGRRGGRWGTNTLVITDHSKAVTVANGLNEKRMVEHIKHLRTADAKGLGTRVLVGSEVVDILEDGRTDYSDEILAQLDVVVCSIHSYFNLDRTEMTSRWLGPLKILTARLSLILRGVCFCDGIPSTTTWKEC